MRLKLLTAVAALVACSGAWAAPEKIVLTCVGECPEGNCPLVTHGKEFQATMYEEAWVDVSYKRCKGPVMYLVSESELGSLCLIEESEHLRKPERTHLADSFKVSRATGKYTTRIYDHPGGKDRFKPGHGTCELATKKF